MLGSQLTVVTAQPPASRETMFAGKRDDVTAFLVAALHRLEAMDRVAARADDLNAAGEHA